MNNQVSVNNNSLSLKDDYAIIRELNGFLKFEAFKLFHNISSVNHMKDIPVLEIGVFCGRSLLGLASAFNEVEVVGVDPFFSDFCQCQTNCDEANFLYQKSNNLSPDQRKIVFNQVLKKLTGKNNVHYQARLVELTQEDFFTQRNKNEKFQLIHIDGEHTFGAVQNCLDELKSLLVPDSWLVVDDFFNPHFPGISEGVHTHKFYKKTIWPVFYGFDKSVYLYNPTSDTIISENIDKLKRLYSDNAYMINLLHDNSIFVYKKPRKFSENKAVEKIYRLSRCLYKEFLS
jgi:hypothetical protein